MRQTDSGPIAIPSTMLGNVVRNLSFAGATPAPPRPDASVAPAEAAAASKPPEPAEQSSAPIRVVLRLRPLSEKELANNATNCVIRAKNPSIVRIKPLDPKRHSVSVRNAGAALFRFERIFDEDCSQGDVFEYSALPMIEGLFSGRSAVVFAYGVTCSGKTWTIQGNDKQPGILSRSLDVILNSIALAKGDGLMQESVASDAVIKLTEGRPDASGPRTRQRGARQQRKRVHDANYIEVDGEVDYQICASYLEIYNEQCYDLFQHQHTAERPVDFEDGTIKTEPGIEPQRGVRKNDVADSRRNPRAKQVLKLKEGSEGEVYAEGLREIEIRNSADIGRLLEFGQQNRFVASTSANETSSRSHAIFFITLKITRTIQQARGPPKVHTLSSRLSIVDLAGSERTKRTNNMGLRQTEASKINTSLMNLGRCLKAIRTNQKNQLANPPKPPKLVPFRESRLTRLLQHSLESGSAVMIVNVSPAHYDADETIHALSCAAIASEIRLAPSKPKVALKHSSKVLRAIDSNIPSNPKAARRNEEKQAKRPLRPKAARKSPAGTGIYKPKTSDPKDKLTIANLRKEISSLLKEANFLRMELEEERCTRLASDRAKEEMYEENDVLFRQNEKLKDKLADSEARICLVAQEVREQVIEDCENVMQELTDRYHRQIKDMWENGAKESTQNRLSVVSDIEQRENAERLANRIALRASQAAFDGLKVSLAADELEEAEASDALEREIEEEYIEEEDETPSNELQIPF